MKEDTIEEYLFNYIPGRIENILDEQAIPDMSGTLFSMQFTVTGGQDFSFGIIIEDAQRIIAVPGKIDKPMIALSIPDDALRPLVQMISLFTRRKQFDLVREMKGTMDVEIGLPDGNTLPLRTVYNGAEEPSFTLSGSYRDLGRMAMGAVDPTQAFMQGIIKLNGDISFALKLSQLAVKNNSAETKGD